MDAANTINPQDRKLSIEQAGTGAAVNLEQTYLKLGPQAAAEQLRQDFLDSIKHPERDARNETALDYEVNRLESDALKGLTLEQLA